MADEDQTLNRLWPVKLFSTPLVNCIMTWHIVWRYVKMTERMNDLYSNYEGKWIEEVSVAEFQLREIKNGIFPKHWLFLSKPLGGDRLSPHWRYEVSRHFAVTQSHVTRHSCLTRYVLPTQTQVKQKISICHSLSLSPPFKCEWVCVHVWAYESLGLPWVTLTGGI